MKPENDDRDPVEVLYDIERELTAPETKSDDLPNELRYVPDKGTTAWEVLTQLQEKNGGVASDLPISESRDVTRPLTWLYRSYLVNRQTKSGAYYYELTELGERVIRSQEQNGTQTDLSDDPTPDPWEDAPVNRSQYYALKALDENPDSTAADINERYCELADIEAEFSTNAPKVAARISELHGMGMIERTPGEPYRNWLSDKGKEVLNDD